MDTGKKIYSSIIAAIIGDSLGVPAEFNSQQELFFVQLKTCSDMAAMIILRELV